MKILIVDDDELQQTLIESHIEKYFQEHPHLEYIISQTRSGISALEFDKVKHYNLVFMDILMPLMNGIDTTKNMKRYNKDVVVVAISSDDSEENKSKTFEAGADDFIPKPISKEAIFRVLDMYCKKN